MTFDPTCAKRFRYEGFELDAAAGSLICHYSLDQLRFVERITFEPPVDGASADTAVERAARLVFLLAGVSYYKAAAPPRIDIGDIALTASEHQLLRTFFVDGLGEYAFRNGLDLRAIEFDGALDVTPAPVRWPSSRHGPLVPFGGGIDSIVTVELVRARAEDLALFVVGRPGEPFDAIEQAAAVAALPTVRAGRELDPQILRSRALGFRNGHVPVTGIVSAIAVLAAAASARPAVVMSNEWSASRGNLEVDGREVNHQFSKSYAFERALRRVLDDNFAAPGVDYFSLLRPFSELLVAQRFASLPQYHGAFRSCNRAFHIDPAQRRHDWCGECDKCAFIDLILAPFLDSDDLARIFGGREPLRNAALLGQFRTLLALGDEPKPFECVGDVEECRVAAVLAAERPDRAHDAMLQQLARELAPHREALRAEAAVLRRPLGPHFIPERYATDDLVG